MKTFKEFLANKQKHEDRNGIKESRKSMSRLMYHQKYDPFVVIMSVERNVSEIGRKDFPDDVVSAIKHGKTINLANTMSFRADLRLNNIGYVPVKGSYIETYRNDVGEEISQKVDEWSQIIYTTNDNKDEILNLCLRWAKKTNQECILYVEHGKGYFLYPEDNHKESVGTFYPDKVGEYYTKLTNNKSFEFTTKNVSEKIKRYFDLKGDDEDV